MFCVGIAVRIISIRTLKSNFSFELRKRNKIVKNGIYKYIRHPSYTGSLIAIFGACLIHSMLGIMIISLAFFLARIANEEQLLSLNEDYVEYKKKTGMLLPRIWR